MLSSSTKNGCEILLPSAVRAVQSLPAHFFQLFQFVHFHLGSSRAPLFTQCSRHTHKFLQDLRIHHSWLLGFCWVFQTPDEISRCTAKAKVVGDHCSIQRSANIHPLRSMHARACFVLNCPYILGFLLSPNRRCGVAARALSMLTLSQGCCVISERLHFAPRPNDVAVRRTIEAVRDN